MLGLESSKGDCVLQKNLQPNLKMLIISKANVFEFDTDKTHLYISSSVKLIVQIPNRCICNTWRLFILQIYFDQHQFWKIQWKCIKIFDYQNKKKYGYKNNISVQYNSNMWKEITIGKDLLHAHDHKKEKTRNFNKLNKNIGTCTRYLTFHNKINLWLLTHVASRGYPVTISCL